MLPSFLLTATAALVLCGCASTDAVTTSVGDAAASGSTTNPVLTGDVLAAPSSSNVVITPNQHTYLDALTSAGIRRSSDLQALSIGSYVCQARAAGQSDQAVWDFILPLVRGDSQDADNAHPGDNPKAPSVDAVTAEYIRIATERLC